MKNRIRIYHSLILLVLFALPYSGLKAQDQPQQEDKNEPARKAFGGTLLIDNQTDVVNIAKTLEWDIQHRFGTVNNGASDLFGIFAPSNIRLGFSYTPINRLGIGVGVSKIVISNPTIDYNLKYKFLQQTKSNKIPVNLTYFGSIGQDTRGGENFAKYVHRFSFFNELIISRRFGPNFSAQIAPMMAHFNAVDTLYSNDIFGVSVAAKIRVSAMGSILLEWTQPLNQHDINSESKAGSLQKDAGPNPNFALSYEIVTSSHVFQIFFTTYRDLLPQNNLVYNTNSLKNREFLIGFNLTRVWNF